MTTDRKAAIAAYKERKTVAGIFVIRCNASPTTWVGQAPDLEKIQNRIWFTLRHGSHRCKSLQAAWNTHGPENFTLEACERLEGEEPPYIRDALLKERLRHWRSAPRPSDAPTVKGPFLTCHEVSRLIRQPLD